MPLTISNMIIIIFQFVIKLFIQLVILKMHNILQIEVKKLHTKIVTQRCTCHCRNKIKFWNLNLISKIVSFLFNQIKILFLYQSLNIWFSDIYRYIIINAAEKNVSYFRKVYVSLKKQATLEWKNWTSGSMSTVLL